LAEKVGELENLARVGKLTAEPGAQSEIKGLLSSRIEPRTGG
jgi:hypothetical protein